MFRRVYFPENYDDKAFRQGNSYWKEEQTQAEPDLHDYNQTEFSETQDSGSGMISTTKSFTQCFQCSASKKERKIRTDLKGKVEDLMVRQVVSRENRTKSTDLSFLQIKKVHSVFIFVINKESS